jgi:hypothetical protein
MWNGQIPVCCPYFAMQSYKFKVKLTPAQGKKGKVAKQAQQMFLKVHCLALLCCGGRGAQRR